MPFYETAAAKDGFEAGVTSALEAMLASPYFIFRMERETEGAPELDDPRRGHRPRVAPVVLPVGHAARQGAAGRSPRRAGWPTRACSKRRRAGCSPTPRAGALGTRFAAQWLRLQDVDKVHPDPNFYPNFDENLAEAMRRETVLFFNSLVQDDRSLLDLFRADYTFVNERLAQHYGIPERGRERVPAGAVPGRTRRGLLGQGSMLVQTSLANRTSPVLRGKWVLEVLVGAPPPAPPPNIPTLEETAGTKDGKLLTTRERMETAPGQRGVQRVPSDDGPDRAGARQLRRDGAVARP